MLTLASALVLLILYTVPVPGTTAAPSPSLAPEIPATIARVPVSADTVLCPARPTSPGGAVTSLCAGQGGGYAEDGHLLLRFDELPPIPGRDVLTVRLGLYREWRGNTYDDADEMVKLVLPAPQPFDEAAETWQSASALPAPNNTVRDFQVAAQLGASPRSHLRLTTNPQGQGEYKYTDITEIARGWFDGTRPNHGLLLITEFAQSAPWVGTAYLTSREGLVQQHPMLEITYATRPAGMPDGRWTIVEATGATESEQTAATELRNYFRRICGEWFEIEPEERRVDDRPAIYVGNTQFARRHGLRTEEMAGEEYVLRRAGNSLILCGGRPRGAFYAVAQFLEGFCGVRWLTLAGEEFVPLRPDLRLPRVDRRSRPAFVDRDLIPPHHWPRTGWYDDATRSRLARALAFGHINGRAPSIYLGTDAPSQRYGGHIRGNHHGHTIRWYLPPEKHFAEHPDFYALRGGKRVDSGLCKTNPAMRDTYFRNITEAISSGAADADNGFIFHISDEDGPPQVCECPDCRAADAHYGGANVGQMLDFLNWLAERGREVWPAGTALETLAYSGYETPPPSGVIRDDVIIRFAPIHKCHWDQLDAAVNRRDLANLKGWLKLAKDVRIWDYPHQYGSGAEPVSSLAITRRGDPGLRAWVQQAIADRDVSQAGLHLSLEGPVAPGERHVFTAGISAFWEPNRGVRPRLLVRWQRPRDRQPTLTTLMDSAAAIVCSEQPDTAIQAVWEAPIQRAGGLELAGTPGRSEGRRCWSYLRFDLSPIPPDARVLDAEMVLSRVFVRGASGRAHVAFRAVKAGTDWDPVRMTWNTQPQVADRPLFSLRLPGPVPGYAGHDGIFPQPNLRALVNNIRLYHELGARGVFMETDAPGLNSGIHCDADLTYWVLMQALWNPTRTADDLIDDFCRHYYGPAGEFITRYVLRLEEAYARDPHRQAFHVGNYALQSFVDLDLISDCQGLFDRAEAACGEDRGLLARVRRARLSLDILTLFNMERLHREYRQRNHSPAGFPFDREAIERRYTEARLASVAERYPDRSLDAEREEIAKLLQAARTAGNWTLWRTTPTPCPL
ncbi:MAG: DUF4838 domain-containing protein [Armatimonadetes bacterium]|nr:DUF4838 domain-containing protein [Armatimonadota bacterium]